MSFLEPGLRLEPHVHDQDVYAQIVAGELELLRNGRSEIYRVGEWFRILAGEEHAVKTSSEVTLLELWRKPKGTES